MMTTESKVEKGVLLYSRIKKGEGPKGRKSDLLLINKAKAK